MRGCLVHLRECDLLGFPGIASYVERESIDAALMGERDIGLPVLRSVGIRVPDHEMSKNIFSRVSFGH